MVTRYGKLVALAVVCLTVALVWLLLSGPGGKDETSPVVQEGQTPDIPQMSLEPTLEQAAAIAPTKPGTPKESATPPPGEQEREQAADLLDFCNKATADLNAGWLGQADVLAFFTRIYLGEWQLPMFKARPGKGNVTKRLTPPDGMFAPAEKTQLVANIQDMIKHLDTMLADYRKLEAYVMDPEVVDNGKLGKSLGATIQKSHAAFAAARDAYLGLLRDRAAQAEDIFLYDHPLKRQIVGARHVFALFSQMANVLGLDKVDRERLQKMQDELVREIATAEAPPFPAKPHMERPFRAFVAEARRFARLSQRGLESGYDNELKRALNDAMVQSRENYNAFVRVANGE